MKKNLLITILGLATVAAFAVQPQTQSTVSKAARLYVMHYEENITYVSKVEDDYEDGEYVKGTRNGQLTFTWDDGAGGQKHWTETDTLEDPFDPLSTDTSDVLDTWPPTYWPNLVTSTRQLNGNFLSDYDGDPNWPAGPETPYIVFQYEKLNVTENYSLVMAYGMFPGLYTETFHSTEPQNAIIDLKFYSGGPSLPKSQSVYQFSAAAWEHRQTGTDPTWDGPIYQIFNIPYQNITVGDLGTLDSDGIHYVQIADDATRDITPRVTGLQWYTFGMPSITKYTVQSKVNCIAKSDPDPQRTSLGVGENVYIGSPGYVDPYHRYQDLPGETKWSTDRGTLSSLLGPSTTLTAPDSAGSATVTASFRGEVQLQFPFSIVEPSSVDATIRGTDTYPNGESGAGMYLDVVLQPTTVSFGNVQMYEVGEDATGVSGYYVYYPPGGHTTDRGANQWHPIGCDNLIGDGMDHAFRYGDPPPWSTLNYSGGSFTWPIPALWRVGTTGATHSLPWSDQTFTLGPDGTMTITKLGHSVKRTINGVITAQ